MDSLFMVFWVVWELLDILGVPNTLYDYDERASAAFMAFVSITYSYGGLKHLACLVESLDCAGLYHWCLLGAYLGTIGMLRAHRSRYLSEKHELRECLESFRLLVLVLVFKTRKKQVNP